MARSTAHTDVLMPVLTGTTSWFAAERRTRAINAQQPSGY
jgi:hypothetical protein